MRSSHATNSAHLLLGVSSPVPPPPRRVLRASLFTDVVPPFSVSMDFSYDSKLSLQESSELRIRFSLRSFVTKCLLKVTPLDISLPAINSILKQALVSWLNCRIPCHSKTHLESVTTWLRGYGATPKHKSMSRNNHATHESNSFFNPCAETIIHKPKQARYTCI